MTAVVLCGVLQVVGVVPSQAAVQEPSEAAGSRDIVFVRTPPGSMSSEVWRMNLDGSSAVRVLRETGGWFGADHVRWSPGGTRLAVAFSSGSTYPDIMTMRPDGSGLRNLTRARGNDFMPAWNPAGTKIAYIGWGTPGTWGLSVMNADGSGKWSFPEQDYYPSWPSWSPDGRRIAHDCPAGICLRPLSAPAKVVPVPGTSGGSQPDWSPDGTRLLYNRGGTIFVTDAAGSRHRTVWSRSTQGAQGAQFSPDGKRIIFSLKWQADKHALAVVGADGTGFKRLTWSRASDTSPDWR